MKQMTNPDLHSREPRTTRDKEKLYIWVWYLVKLITENAAHVTKALDYVTTLSQLQRLYSTKCDGEMIAKY
jgi:hypothetical protein